MTHRKSLIARASAGVILTSTLALSLGAPLAAARTPHPAQWYYANTAACTKAIKTGKTVTAKTFNTCWNGVVRSPAPCLNPQTYQPTGQKGQLVVVGKRTVALHIGSKPDYLPKNYTLTRVDKDCR